MIRRGDELRSLAQNISKRNAESAFNQDVPNEYLQAEWVCNKHYPTAVSLTYTTDFDQSAKSLILSGNNVAYKDTSYTLNTDFFMNTDFDHELKVIYVPWQRFVDARKFVGYIGDEVRILFIESSQEPGRMVPFVYDNSIESSTNMPTDAAVYKHSFRNVETEWRIVIVQQLTQTLNTITQIVSQTTSSATAQLEQHIIDELTKTVYGSPKSRFSMNVDAINQIIRDIQLDDNWPEFGS